jgi:hypothetical protein
VARVIDDLAVVNVVPSISGAALRCRGLVDDDPTALVAATEAYARGPRILDTAVVQEEAAQVLLQHSQPQAGRAQLT